MANLDLLGRSSDCSVEPGPCATCMVRRSSMCSALASNEIGDIARIMATVRLDPGETLFGEGDRADAVYNVTAGTLKTYKLLPDGRRQITGFMVPGDFVGFGIRDEYPTSAEAVVGSCLCRFPRGPLNDLLVKYPTMQRRLFGIASKEIGAAQDQMLLLGRKSAKEKIASFLLGFSRKAERVGLAGNPIHLTMNRSDIADFLGLTTETVSRTFTLLKRQGLIRLLPGGGVMLVDMDTLRDMADEA